MPAKSPASTGLDALGAAQEVLATSKTGIAFLERHEGVVLKSYRDVVGVWTIGPGLTAASGVVKPKPGMIITRAEASALLGEALAKNYEPAVRATMPNARQCEFDGGVSFHFNTGAIGRASWVNAWLVRQWPGVHAGLMKWVKGGGKVLPGLKRRREEEFRLMYEGLYTPSLPQPAQDAGRGWAAKFTIRVNDTEMADIRNTLRSLGYEPGANPRFVDATAVMRFQRDHDLTVDGIVGRATLSTLQRRLNAQSAIKAPAVTGAVGGGQVVAGPAPDLLPVPDWTGWLVLGLAALWLLRLGWVYRDVLAAKVGRIFPEAAAFLRKF